MIVKLKSILLVLPSIVCARSERKRKRKWVQTQFIGKTQQHSHVYRVREVNNKHAKRLLMCKIINNQSCDHKSIKHSLRRVPKKDQPSLGTDTHSSSFFASLSARLFSSHHHARHVTLSSEKKKKIKILTTKYNDYVHVNTIPCSPKWRPKAWNPVITSSIYYSNKWSHI